MKESLPKWLQTIKICWSKFITYRLNFLLQVLGPAIVFFYVKYNLWSAIYNQENITLNGYSFPKMIEYHLYGFIVSMIAQGHVAWNLSEEIRLGKISSYLIYPFNFWEFHSANFIAFQLLQLLVSSTTLGVVVYLGIIEPISFLLLVQGFLICLLISIFWFSLQFLTGLFAFWLEETWILRVMLQVMTTFLSGAILPLEFFPKPLQAWLQYTPFPYLTYAPIRFFMGETAFNPQGIIILALWFVFIVWACQFVWKRGLRLYAGSGM